MKKEFRNWKSFKPNIHPLHCGDLNRETILDGLCQQDQQRQMPMIAAINSIKKSRNQNNLIIFY